LQVSFEGEVPYLPNTSLFENCQKLAFLDLPEIRNLPEIKTTLLGKTVISVWLCYKSPRKFSGNILLRTSFPSKKITPDFLYPMKSKEKTAA